MGEVLEPLNGTVAKENAEAKSENETPKQETLAEILAKPLSEAEARKMLASADVQLAQMRALRIQKSVEISNLDYQIAVAEFDKAIAYRRVLNEAPASATSTEVK